MKFGFLLLFLLILPCFQAQTNISLVSRVDYQATHNTYLNDIWGHVDQNGIEYALVGARLGTSVVSLANPTSPLEVFWEPGAESIWRDLKTWKNYAYVTTEAKSGLLILDLSSLPDASQIAASYYTGPTSDTWLSAHNLFIDSNGYAYIFGADRDNGGVIILDVHTDPLNPVEVGSFDNWYCHDGIVINDTMYLAHIFDGIISIVDVTDKANPVLLGVKNTPNNFSHNIWTTPNGDYGFTTDEVSGGHIGSFDLRNPSNIIELDRIQSSPGAGVVPHNAHVKGDFLITSHYSDGVTIHDISRPSNLVEVGAYDTYPIQTKGTDGCWGAYPFLPSGFILATDIEEGLFVLNPTYKHACFLEGLVSDLNTSAVLNQVKVEITGYNQLEYTDLNGLYEAGILTPGTYQVTFSKVGYYPQTISVNLSENNVTTLSVALEPIPVFILKVIVKDAGTNNPIVGADLILSGSLTSDTAASNGLGEHIFSLYYKEGYDIICGKWGYVTHCEFTAIDETTGQLTLMLTPGIYDDFTFDFGWTATASVGVSAGNWERGKPYGTDSGSAPSTDVTQDCGNAAYVTGNSSNISPGFGDVQKGSVSLLSPVFDLTGYSTPYVSFNSWFYNYHGVIPFDDSLKIYLSNGDSSVLIHYLFSNEPDFYQWHQLSVEVKEVIVPTAQMQLLVYTSDFTGNDNITEAGFDYFRVTEFSTIGLNENETTSLKLYPNPVTGEFTLTNLEAGILLELHDLNGKLLGTMYSEQKTVTWNISHLDSGVYLLKAGKTVSKILKL